MKNDLLLVTPKPAEDESFSGYCVRTSELNGYSDLSEFKRSNIPDDLKSEALTKAIMAKLTGHNLVQLSAKSDGVTTQVKGKAVLTNLLTDPKICPDCIQESGYHLGMHDIKAVTSCVKHRRILVSYCPKCITNISSGRPFLLQCKCGFDLTKASSIPLSEAEFDLQKVIDSVIYGHALQDSVSVSGMPFAQLSNLPLNTLLMMIESIGTKSLWFDIKKRMQVRFTPQEITKSAADVFSNWPNNFIGFLDKFEENYISTQKSSRNWRNEHLSQIGAPYADINSEYMCEQYLSYLVKYWPMDLSKNISGKRVNSSFTDYSSLAMYATISGTNPSWVEREFEINNLHEVRIINNTESVKIVLLLNDGERMPHGDAIYKDDGAARYLGISLNLFNRLITSGYLIQNHRTGKFKRYAKPDLDSFLMQLHSGITTQDLPTNKFVSFSLACKLQKRFREFPLYLLIKMLKGDVRILGAFKNFEDALLYEPDVDSMHDLMKTDKSTKLGLFSYERRCVNNQMISKIESLGILEQPIKDYDSLLKI